MTDQQKNNKLERKVNFLSAYAIISATSIGFFILSGFSPTEKVENFDEITVKKITVLGEDHLPRIVLSNETRQHPGRMDGKEMEPRERPSGIIFFNNEGDECGGLIYKTDKKEGKVSSGMSFTMDNYKDDQVIQILNDEFYTDGKAYIKRGISINQYPVGSSMVERNNKLKELRTIEDEKDRREKINQLIKKEGPVNRLFIGKTKGNSSGLFLAGPDGAPKMMIYVDENGNPKIQTFNDKGEIKDFLESE